jgi:DNA polymerase-3 subunit alpha
MSDFVHLHVHTRYSMLDGLCKLSDLVATAKSFGQTAVAMTDHGNLYGAIHFYNACKKADIKPIIGCEVYVAKKSRFDKQVKPGADQYHLTLLAQNFAGYQNLLKLVTVAHLEGFSYKPRVDDEVLAKHTEGVIATSGCPSSRINRLLKEGDYNHALEQAKLYKELFKDRFYIELQIHPSMPDLKVLNDQLVKIARELNLPLLATNDVHYLTAADAPAQDALLCVQTRKLISDEKRMKMIDHPDFYLKSTEEMVALFKDYPEAIENTVKLAAGCELEIPTGKLHFPVFEIPEGETEGSYLKQLAVAGLHKKVKDVTPEMLKRLDYELEIINSKGYSAYFLITQDFVNWAKNQGIGVGPGRGSAAGALVSYALNITTLNPLVHGLPFERFLNPQRPTPPDIDMDFADDRREEVIEYVAEKYGRDHVAQVITFGKMEARVAIRDIGRVLGLSYEDPDKIAKLIPNDPGKKTSLDDALATVPELAEYYKEPKFKKLIDLAKKVEGTFRHSSVHAAALIIADKPLPEYTALQKDTKSGKMITQYDMYALDCNVSDDAIGLLKFDFLGLRNLSTIQTAVQLIKQQKNIDIDVDTLPLDDAKTFAMLSEGDTTGVFQLESAGMRRVAKTLQPNQFSDITAMVALFRPGPMDLIPKFIEGKHKPETVIYPHPSLEPILKETYGIMVYQEQILQIANVMAGYSLGEADILRRAIGKKKKSLLDENKKGFIKQSVDKGYEKGIAEKVWGFIEAFANYGFNKSHAACYAMIAYQTAYLKANYPVEYMTALMSVESDSHSANRDEKVAICIESSKKMGIKILPPDINLSHNDFTIEPHEDSLEKLAVRFGFSAIKHVGTAAIENVLETRQRVGQFTSFTQFVHETDGRKVNKKGLECFIKVGAMDRFGTRASMLENLESIRQTASQFQSEIDGQDNLFANVGSQTQEIKDSFPVLAEYPSQELLSFEKELLGLYLTDHPMAESLKAVNKRSNKNIADIDQLVHQGQSFIFGGYISKLRETRTKKTGALMAFGTIEDETGSMEFVVFPKTYEQYHSLLQLNAVVLMKAKVELREESLSLLVEKISIPTQLELESSQLQNYKEIFIPRQTDQTKLQALGKLLKSHPGSEKVVILIPNGTMPERMVLPYTVAWDQSLEAAVLNLLH